ncbi:MAG: AAC(3) family N-acetyltransferase [Magnetococcales bacterium]|nr:AAC(3) family N-acetyltransferase [Magnetococcales bacterium]
MDHKIVEQLARDWRTAGVTEGDTLLVHSSLSRTMRRVTAMGGEATPDLVMKSFLEVLGESGTLLLPLFNFGFARGAAFDIRNTPSQMGALTEAGRLWPGVIRTGHPIYSFGIIGRHAHLFRGLKNVSGFGADSPFGILHRLNGKIGVIDLPDRISMTFYHYVEECFGTPYRYHKMFAGEYTDDHGVVSEERFSFFVRDLEQGVVSLLDPMGEILWKKGLYSGFRPQEGCGLRVIPASSLFDEVTTVLKENRARGLLYDIQPADIRQTG